MGIFTNSSRLSYYNEEGNEVELPLDDTAIDNHEEVERAQELGVDPGVLPELPTDENDPVEECYRIMAESDTNFHNIMMAVGISELHSYQESGVDYLTEAVDLKAYWTKVKNFFIKLKEKVWGIVKSFISTFAVHVQKGEKFVSKNSTAIKDGWKKIKSGDVDFEFKGYKFGKELDSYNANEYTKDIKVLKYEDFKREISRETNMTAEDIDSFRKDFRKEITNGDSADFSVALFKKFHGGSEEKEDLSPNDINIENVLKIIRTGKKDISNVKDNYKKLEKTLNEAIKSCDNLSKKIANDKNEEVRKLSSAAAISTQLLKNTCNDVIQTNTAHMKGLKDRLSQCKAIALKAVYAGNRRSLKAESASSMIGAVDFV